MRILVLAQSAGIGGVESSLASFLDHLAVRGDDVDLVFWRETGPLRNRLPSNVKVLDIQTGLARWIYRSGGRRQVAALEGIVSKSRALGGIVIRKVLRSMGMPWALLRAIDQSYDVAIAYRHQGYAPYYLVDKVVANRKFMWFHHGSYTPSLLGHRRDAHYFEQLDAIISVSQSSRDVFRGAFPELADKVRVIRNITDADRVRTLAESPIDDEHFIPADLTLITVSRLTAEKGIDLAANAALLLRRRGLEFVWYVVGDGPEREHLESLVTELGIQDSFILLGERVNPFPYMARADIYVQTSRVEAYGLTIEEAKILRRPIVASNLPSALEVLEDGELGVLCSVDATAIADAVYTLAADPTAAEVLRNRLSSVTIDNHRSRESIDHLLADATRPVL